MKKQNRYSSVFLAQKIPNLAEDNSHHKYFQKFDNTETMTQFYNFQEITSNWVEHPRSLKTDFRLLWVIRDHG